MTHYDVIILVLKKIKTEKKRKMSLLYDQLEKARKDLLQVMTHITIMTHFI